MGKKSKEEQITIWNMEDERRAEVRGALPHKEVKRLISKMGGCCSYCGATEHLILHHVISVENEGDSREGNLMVLCEKHHKQAHAAKHRKYTNNGRPRIERPPNFEIYAEAHFLGITTFKEVLNDLGLKKNTFYRMFQEWKEETGNTGKAKWTDAGNPNLKKGVKK